MKFNAVIESFAVTMFHPDGTRPARRSVSL
jgi:hypothetical protein